MESYILFFMLAAVTVLSPGPGVVLTLTNSIRYGASGATAGILGIAAAAFLVAGVAASSLGILLATSALAFTILKFVGAAYLLYLGLRLWFSPPATMAQPGPSSKRRGAQFLEGFTVQLTNPKTVFFFMAVFPQFVDLASPYLEQFVLLVTTYSVLVAVIHIAYAHSAGLAKGWLSTEKGGRLVNRAGGSAFIGFGALLAASGK
ncbi:LysE family translocator [Marinobacter salicampi]|uniref:LysE family translocator n=1 Tax=Marinobacter salicampi TaxID=435907 RepID=UPI00140C3243|nr:LysE family transporter [Marinobacter salicampi]